MWVKQKSEFICSENETDRPKYVSGTDVSAGCPLSTTTALYYWISIWQVPGFFLLHSLFLSLFLAEQISNPFHISTFSVWFLVYVQWICIERVRCTGEFDSFLEIDNSINCMGHQTEWGLIICQQIFPPIDHSQFQFLTNFLARHKDMQIGLAVENPEVAQF